MATNSVTAAVDAALNYSPNELTGKQRDSLKGLEPQDAARMEAQMKLQNYQEQVSFISNIMKKRNEIAMAVIGNLR